MAPPNTDSYNSNNLILHSGKGLDFENVVDYTRRVARAIGRRYSLTGDDCDDIAQNSAFKAWQKPLRGTTESEARAFLGKIVFNETMLLLRQLVHRHVIQADLDKVIADTEQMTEEDRCLLSADIEKGLQSLNDDSRYCFVRRYLFEADCSQIAEELGTSRVSVYKILERARSHMRKHLARWKPNNHP